jgi:hypothetical protein
MWRPEGHMATHRLVAPLGNGFVGASFAFPGTRRGIAAPILVPLGPVSRRIRPFAVWIESNVAVEADMRFPQ